MKLLSTIIIYLLVAKISAENQDEDGFYYNYNSQGNRLCGDPFAQWLTCGSVCPKTCENPTAECASNCIAGCFCKPGYVLNPSGNCVPQYECYKYLNTRYYNNEISDVSAGRNRYEDNNHYNVPKPTEPTTTTTTTQIYINPFSPNSGNRCQGLNEVWAECASACKKTCEDFNPPCSGGCVARCICKPGYVRNKFNFCVPTEHCFVGLPKTVNRYDFQSPKRCYGVNEIWSDCGSLCPQTCPPKERSCSDLCIPGCICINGHVRNSFGYCISDYQCYRQQLLEEYRRGRELLAPKNATNTNF